MANSTIRNSSIRSALASATTAPRRLLEARTAAKVDFNRGRDPETDYERIYRNLTVHDFPWDMNQSLSFALFRTYAVPSIGRLLAETRQFCDFTQKRYDDTALLLEEPLVNGLDSDTGRAAVRRINQMHKMYNISNDDMRYVLATFVVVPKRWIDDYGWRPLTDDEVLASVRYYQNLGKHMAIKEIPGTYDDFASFMDSYEDSHFGYDAAARRVADSTLELLTTFYPRIARRGVDAFSRALMDEPLRTAFGYDDPGAALRAASKGALRLRGKVLAVMPSRTTPKYVRDMPNIRSYPSGYQIDELGTFAAAKCPVPHA